jgi:hypothetical protein
MRPQVHDIPLVWMMVLALAIGACGVDGRSAVRAQSAATAAVPGPPLPGPAAEPRDSTASSSPGEWKTLEDSKGECQISRPSGWTASPTEFLMASEPGGNGMALMDEADRTGWNEYKTVQRAAYPPSGTLEDSGTRLLIQIPSSSGAGMTYVVARRAEGYNCNATVSAETDDLTITARRIAESVDAAR